MAFSIELTAQPQTFQRPEASDAVAGPDAAPNREDSYEFSVAGVGLDTISFAFRSLDETVLRGFYEGTLAGPSGELLPVRRQGGTRFVMHEKSGTRIGLTTSPKGERLAWAEGRLAALLANDASQATLASSHGIVEGAVAASEIAKDLGVDLSSAQQVTVRRADLAGDVRFTEPRDGLDFLQALGTLDLSGCKRNATTGRGHSNMETVAWSNGGGIVARAYDRGANALGRGNSELWLPGQVVRLERQMRPQKSRQRRPEVFAAQDLAAVFGDVLSGWHSQTFVIRSPIDGWFKLKNALGRELPGGDVLTLRKAERIMGSAVALAAEGDAAYDNRRTALERRRELRAVGLALDHAPLRSVPVGQVVRALTEAWRAR